MKMMKKRFPQAKQSEYLHTASNILKEYTKYTYRPKFRNAVFVANVLISW